MQGSGVWFREIRGTFHHEFCRLVVREQVAHGALAWRRRRVEACDEGQKQYVDVEERAGRNEHVTAADKFSRLQIFSRTLAP